MTRAMGESHWNHRVVRRKHKAPQGEEDIYYVEEVYYDEDGSIAGLTDEGISVTGDSVDSLRWTLEKMLACLDKPVIDDERLEETV